MQGNCSSTKIGVKLELGIPATRSVPAPTASVIHLWDGKSAVTKSNL